MEQAAWPNLDYPRWRETGQTLLRWLQIVGKIRLSKSPWTNHAWNSALYVTERGVTTSVIHDVATPFSLELDFVSHELVLRRAAGHASRLALRSEPVAEFYARCQKELNRAGIEVRIFGRPNELPDDLPFAVDRVHASYEPELAHAFWKSLLQADRLMKHFRSRFLGKASPVHLFWGAMDLAVTRFSGRRAPEHPGGIPHLPDLLTREAYSHEVSSCGFWPGNDAFAEAAFYSYAYPKPEGFERAKVPEGAYFHPALREFLLPYAVVRSSPDPDSLVLGFFQRTYEAAADLAGWDREALEHSPYLDVIHRRAA